MELMNQQPSDIDYLKKYLKIFWRRKLLIFACVIAGFTLSLIYAVRLKITPIYQASVTLEINEQESNVRLLPYFNLIRRYPVYWGSPEGKIMMQIMSSAVIELVVDELNLDKMIHSMSPGLSFSLTDIQTDQSAKLGTYRVQLHDKNNFTVYDPCGTKIGDGHSGVPFERSGIRFVISEIFETEGKGEFRISLYPRSTVVNAIRGAIRTRTVSQQTLNEKVGLANDPVIGAAKAENPHRANESDPLESSGIVQIDVFWKDPKLSMEIVNTLANVIIERESDNKRAEHTNAREFIEQQLATYAQKLKDSEQELQQFKEVNKFVSLDLKENDIIYKSADIEAEIARVLGEKEKISLFKSKMSIGLKPEDFLLIGSIPVIGDQYQYWDALGQMTTQLINLQIQLSVSLEEFTEDHPEAVKLRKEVEQTQFRLEQQLNARISMLDIKEESFKQQLAQYQLQLQDFPLKEIELARLERSFKINEEIYVSLSKQYEETRLAEVAIVNDVQILDYADLPRTPVNNPPNKKKIVFTGIILSMIIGFSLAYLLDYIHNSITDIDEIESELQLPVYGMIPHISGKKTEQTDTNESRSEIKDLKHMLVTESAPRSLPSEAYRSLRTNIQFFDLSRQSEVILISSAMVNEGKSLTSANLAIVTAQAGRKTLLVDGDLRKSAIHKLFGLHKDPGLTDVLLKKYSLFELIRSTHIPNLDVLTAGTKPPNPPELLGSAELTEIINEAKQRYDLILFDSPPIIPVADSVALSTKVDGVLLIVFSGKTNRVALQRTITLLKKVNARLVGAVMNNVQSHDLYGYKQYYDSDQV